MTKIIIYLGHYGSGKTELSIAEALLLSKNKSKVTLVDLDIVNPYFRSGEHKKMLNENGIKVIMPNFEGTNVAIPSLPAEINSVFVDEEMYTVFDVGGSPSGATALGVYSGKIKSYDYETVLVVNTLRPFTSTAKEICEMAEAIMKKGRVDIQSVINNTNAAYHTTAAMVENAQKTVEEAAKMLGAQVTGIRALPQVISSMSNRFKEEYADILKPIELFMRPEWMDV